MNHFGLRWCGLTAAVLTVYFVLPAEALRFGMTAVSLCCAAAVLRRAGRLPQSRMWRLVGAYLLSTGIGEALWAAYELAGKNPFPSWADVFYLGAYPMLGLGLVLLVQQHVPGGDRAGVIDAAIVAVGASALMWVSFGTPYVAKGGSVLGVGVALAYPAADLLLLGILCRLMLASGLRSGSVRALSVGLTALLVSDMGFLHLDLRGAYSHGDAIDAGWLIFYLMTVAAAWHPSAATAADRSARAALVNLHPARLALLGAAVLMAPIVLIFQATDGVDNSNVLGVAIVTTVLCALVLVRIAMLFRQMGAQAAMLARLGDTDPLTGTQNRRAWDRELARTVEVARRTGFPLSVVIMDIDHFKRINDERGHTAGDEFLVAAARAWTSVLRVEDQLARYGGEEFAVALPGLDAGAATIVAERFRLACPDGQTCSIGVAALADGESGMELLARADAALYAAKRTGRNRTSVAPDPVADPAAHHHDALRLREVAPDRRLASRTRRDRPGRRTGAGRRRRHADRVDQDRARDRTGDEALGAPRV